jgi:putative transposase
MPKGLKRYYGQGHFHFLTFSCYRRLPLLGTARARNVFVAALAKIRERYRLRLIGYVVMPEHVHLLISESAKCTPSLVLKVLKQRVSRDLRKRRRRVPTGQMRLVFKEGDAGLPRFWQPRFYDFNVYSARKIREKLEYMHANQVKRGLAGNPSEWAWSSFLSYEKESLDWCRSISWTENPSESWK